MQRSGERVFLHRNQYRAKAGIRQPARTSIKADNVQDRRLFS